MFIIHGWHYLFTIYVNDSTFIFLKKEEKKSADKWLRSPSIHFVCVVFFSKRAHMTCALISKRQFWHGPLKRRILNQRTWMRRLLDRQDARMGKKSFRILYKNQATLKGRFTTKTITSIRAIIRHKNKSLARSTLFFLPSDKNVHFPETLSQLFRRFLAIARNQ